MDIINVPVEVGLITDEVIPKTALPYTAFAPLGAAM